MRLSRELNGFHIDMISAVHFDRTLTAIPVIVLGVSWLVRMQRGVVCEFVSAVISIAWRWHRLSLNSMLTSYEYDSKNGQADHYKAPNDSSHYSSKVYCLLLRRSGG